ncbi:kinase-like protein [Annulohypoxylon maeteangense]|uniref:kinase-like protein n=1 Tax=Annulohypoxylon maeteangense TaxID=1927788 RepID=UPI00200734E1|nr:kinase-like protein [Annulohypoxylon maeteangense]KAI0881286.1 kinase-like protein [Annulohypoxylon maeteangense]
MATVGDDVCPPHDIQAFTDLDGATGVPNEGKPEGEYTTFWKYYQNGEAYFAQIFKPRPDINIAEVKEAMRRIPDADIYPEIPEGVNLKEMATTEKPDTELYIKRPSLLTYETSSPHEWIRDVFLGEAEIMEKVSSIQHKNIIQYYGCLKRDGRLAGIALERHKCNLNEFFMWQMDKNGAIDSQRFMEELESAIFHLHQAGLAHNDLKPSNILLDKDNLPVLIDYGSCRPFGGRLMEGGTPGWCDHQKLVMFSDKEHDLFGLNKIREWLADPDRKLNG